VSDDESDRMGMANDEFESVRGSYQDLLREVRGIISFVDRRSKDASIEMHERQQWRRLLIICRRAIGEG
jgi:hypothetical protein